MAFRTDEQRKAAYAKGRKSVKAQAGQAPLSLKQYQYINSKRSLGALMLDLSQGHQDTVVAKDPRSRQWLRDQGNMDIIGVDDPDAEFQAASAGKDAPRYGTGLVGEWVMIPVRPKGAKKRRMSKAQARKRADNIKALKGKRAEILAAIKDAEVHRDDPKASKDQVKNARKTLKNLRVGLHNVNTHLRAYRQGKYLVVGRKEDLALIKTHARLVQDSFDFHPANMATAAVYIGRTEHPGAAGYTHQINVTSGYKADFIALNEKVYDLKKPASRKQRLTHVHEQIHVNRVNEGGRQKPSARAVGDYGRDRDVEEKYTVAETQLRGGPVGDKRDESYYSILRAEERRRGGDLPVRVGDLDNRILNGTARPQKSRDLDEIQDNLENRGPQTRIARLHHGKSSGWGEVPPAAEGIDREFVTSDGDKVHVYNPTNQRPDNKALAQLTDRIDGRPGDKVFEYHDGKKRPVGRTKRKV